MVDSLGPVVVDTGVFSATLHRGRRDLQQIYAKHLEGRPIVLSFQSVAELRFGALHAGWGKARRDELESRLAGIRVALGDDAMAAECAALRERCSAAAHALGQKEHNGDCWIAAAAIRYGLPLVAHDRIFISAPGLHLITELSS